MQPAGVFTMICGVGAGVGSAMISSNKIDMISLTCSTDTGQRI
ncbi:aldehyde dehydrogenase family protein [Stutzerimonas stutzeri]|nr:aldehyde dehydrogenase family protein [Stutzerimonas stutzeri]RRW03498.1 aldehyde dehydrogenase family protein [Stutzerimonas stutzeri]